MELVWVWYGAVNAPTTATATATTNSRTEAESLKSECISVRVWGSSMKHFFKGFEKKANIKAVMKSPLLNTTTKSVIKMPKVPKVSTAIRGNSSMKI